MQVGDLVTLKMMRTQPPQQPQRAMVIDKYSDQDGFIKLEVVWMTGHKQSNLPADHFEVISEGG
jgi:hypothetical protein|tara:strand:- start:116 stop:307 length:192 start_codon:yes stop_codon:yes gene_type:complete